MMMLGTYTTAVTCGILKKNLNAPRPSEHPPVREENAKTFLVGGIIGCKYCCFVG